MTDEALQITIQSLKAIREVAMSHLHVMLEKGLTVEDEPYRAVLYFYNETASTLGRIHE